MAPRIEHVGESTLLIVHTDCHFRVGGATGTDLRKADCPKLSGNVNSKCIAGAVMLLKTEKGSGYISLQR